MLGPDRCRPRTLVELSSVTMPLMACTCKCCCTERLQPVVISLPGTDRRFQVLITTAEGQMVDTVYNGVRASLLHRADWRKSSYSNPSGNCVETAQLPAGEVAVRNSRFPDGPALIFTPAEWEAFVLGARDGDFDLPS